MTAPPTPPPAPLTGADLAIAFVATGSPRLGRDPLAAPETLAAWMRAADPAKDRELLASPPRARALMGEALALRGAIARLFSSTSAGGPPPPDALFVLNRVLAAGARTSRLEPAPDGGWVVVGADVGAAPLSLLAPIALAAAELLASVDPRRLRACEAPDCATWFVDTSKGGRRRWCSMAACGNRAKAARHRRRRAASR